jgi:hypothetical protein
MFELACLTIAAIIVAVSLWFVFFKKDDPFKHDNLPNPANDDFMETVRQRYPLAEAVAKHDARRPDWFDGPEFKHLHEGKDVADQIVQTGNDEDNFLRRMEENDER